MHKLCILEVDNTEYKIPEKVIKSYQKLQQENQQLKSMICPIYEKCQKGECDCTHEEYDSMCERNMKMSLELDKYKSIIEGLDKWFKSDEFIPTPTNNVPIEIQNFINDIENKIKELEEGDSNA